MDVESDRDHRLGGFDRLQVTLEAIFFPLDVQESDAFEFADVTPIGVASAQQPAKSAGNSKEVSTVSYEFQDHLAENAVSFFRAKQERYHPTGYSEG